MSDSTTTFHRNGLAPDVADLFHGIRKAGSHIGSTQIFVAPSTSGAAGGFWDESIWIELEQWVKRP